MWAVVDNHGYLTLTCDGKRVADFFPTAGISKQQGVSPEWIIAQAHRIAEVMNRENKKTPRPEGQGREG